MSEKEAMFSEIAKMSDHIAELEAERDSIRDEVLADVWQSAQKMTRSMLIAWLETEVSETIRARKGTKP